MSKKIKAVIKWLKSNLKDYRTFIIFIIVAVVLYSSVYIPFSLAVIFADYKAQLISAGTTMAVLWASPVLPFFPITLIITLGIKGIFNKWKNRKNDKQD